MLYALIDGKRSLAVPSLDGTCPGCGGRMIAKCGEINAWHWAHEAQECDPWHEPESSWHRRWKSIVNPERTEVTIGPHRADIQTSDGLVVELQHSSISADTIRERERFYGRMRWIFDATGWHLDFRDRGNYLTFRWKWPRKSLGAVTMPMLWDLGKGYLLNVAKLDVRTPSGGWGRLVHISSLVESPSAPDLTQAASDAFRVWHGKAIDSLMYSARFPGVTGHPTGVLRAIELHSDIWRALERRPGDT